MALEEQDMAGKTALMNRASHGAGLTGDGGMRNDIESGLGICLDGERWD